MLTPERKRMMMVVTCLLSFLLAMSTEKVVMLVRKPRMDRVTLTQPATLWVSELIIVFEEIRRKICHSESGTECLPRIR